ncbi:COG2958 family protein [Motiliproteus sp. MSK22-1]|uniref:COG2958 family protein n=1 Tax=Motiliproteus sp. MSK22-1 TaxID=1897630 RepID=UPI000976D556|nr:HrgA protein [Motiliproteus sp. MSK22-1]OMH39413.1 HrgA protein [Motiliproteus sp. MSK22-1]
MALNLAKTVRDYLQSNQNQKFTAREIAIWIYQTYPDECQDKQRRSDALQSKDDLIQQIVREIASQRPRLQRKHPQIRTTEGRPRKYYFTEQSESEEVNAAEVEVSDSKASSESKPKEHDLYPLLSEYLWTEFSLYSKRIDEKRSSNKRGPNGNKWLYPDVVAMEDLSSEWHQEVKDCVGQYADKRTKLWSFEVKLLINRSNIRECFFQAVSNSSWANYGYLVASEIEGTDTLKELRMLFSAHGIGLIQLDIDNPADSQILVPAKERLEIDWDTANRLTVENKDFLDFVKLVRQFYQTGDPRASAWDLVAP